MFFVVRSNDSFNLPLGLIKYIVIINRLHLLMHNCVRQERCELFGSREQRYLKAINFIDIHTQLCMDGLCMRHVQEDTQIYLNKQSDKHSHYSQLHAGICSTVSDCTPREAHGVTARTMKHTDCTPHEAHGVTARTMKHIDCTHHEAH